MRFLRDEHGTRIRHSLTKSTSGTSLVGGFAEMLGKIFYRSRVRCTSIDGTVTGGYCPRGLKVS